MARAPQEMPSGPLDALVHHVLVEGELDDIVGMALLLCDIRLGLTEQTETAWPVFLREGGLIYDVLFRAMRGLAEQDKFLQSFRLAQRWKVPLSCRPYIDHWRKVMPPRQELELSGFYAAFDTLKEGLRQLQASRNDDELRSAIDWTRSAGQGVLDALDRRSLSDPLQALRLGRIVFPDELIDGLPARGGAVCLLDFMVSREGTFIHVLGRKGGSVDVRVMIAREFTLALALELAGVYDSLVVRKTDPERQEEGLEYVCDALHHKLWCQLARNLGQLGLSQIILVPDAWTRALPHHLSKVCGDEVAIPEDVPVVKRERVADLFPLEIAPSVQALAVSQWQLRPKTVQKLVMLADPGGDLPGAAWTAKWMESRLSQDVEYEALVGPKATRDGLLRECRDANMIVFCGHGSYRAEAPLLSSLQLSNGGLSLSDIQEGEGVTPRAVYVLSACELGTGSPGESIRGHAFPGALLAGGAACVLAALWEMEDVSFGYLTERFLYHLAYPGRRPAAALFRAMNDTKDWPRDEVRDHVRAMLDWMEQSGRAAEQPRQHLRLAELLAWVEDESGPYPFHEQKYWGGAIVFGSGWAFQSGAHIADYEHPMRWEEMMLRKRGTEVSKLIIRRQFKTAKGDLDEWLSWAHGPERIEPCALQADLVRHAGGDPRIVANLYQRLCLLSRAHEDRRTEAHARENIELLRRGQGGRDYHVQLDQKER